MKKRVLSILLALMMVVSMMSAMTVTSFADVQNNQLVVAQESKIGSFSVFSSQIKKLLNSNLKEIKEYKPLIGVKKVRFSKDLRNDLNQLTKHLMSGKANKDVLKTDFKKVSEDILINAKDVVVFSGTADGKYSPIYFAKPGATVYVRVYGTSNKASDVSELPKKLASISTLLPGGFRVTETSTVVTVTENGKSLTVPTYSFVMPSRMVTGYDFLAYNNLWDFIKIK